MKRMIASVLILLALAAGGAARACDLQKPQGEVILVVDGAVKAAKDGGAVAFDKAMLEALPHHQVTTENPWDPGPPTYEGVLLSDILECAGAGGSLIDVKALNDYGSQIPIADLAKYGVILAFKRDGADLPVRDKGPLFVVFPFSQYPELKTEARYAQSVWQVNRITVK